MVVAENNGVAVMLRYLSVLEYSDVRLLFEAVLCLSTLLIHVRFCWDFVSMDGMKKLIRVNRQSLAAAAVCVCFHHMAQYEEVMEQVSQTPDPLLDDIVKWVVELACQFLPV